MIHVLILLQFVLAGFVVWRIMRRIPVDPYESWAPLVGAGVVAVAGVSVLGFVVGIVILCWLYLNPVNPPNR